jgi:hypothetical protein
MFFTIRSIFILVCLTLLSQTSISNAEPSKYIKTLMDRPFSMLDWGMYITEKGMEEDFEKYEWNKNVYIEVNYDWDTDNIVISVSDPKKKDIKTYEVAEESCKTYFDWVDLSLLIYNGKNILSSSVFAQNFFHKGWQNESMKNATDNIPDKAIVKIIFSDYSCTRKLMATKFSVTKN